MSHSNLRPLIPFPALLLNEGSERTLVVADLHIGWEVNLVEQGIHIPSQISRLQARLLQIIEDYRPEQIVFLGDVKQSIPRITFEEWKTVPEFFETIQKHVSEVVVVLGNHDGDLEPLTPRTVKIFPSGGMAIGKEIRIGLFHGHAWPSSEVLQCGFLIMGHIHPVLRFRDKLGVWMVKQIWVKAEIHPRRLATAYLKHLNITTPANPENVLKEKGEIELKEARIIIMPAFNDLVGGVSINRLHRNLIGPLLGSNSVQMDDAELYLLDGTFIGVVKQIRTHFSG